MTRSGRNCISQNTDCSTLPRMNTSRGDFVFGIFRHSDKRHLVNYWGLESLKIPTVDVM